MNVHRRKIVKYEDIQPKVPYVWLFSRDSRYTFIKLELKYWNNNKYKFHLYVIYKNKKKEEIHIYFTDQIIILYIIYNLIT